VINTLSLHDALPICNERDKLTYRVKLTVPPDVAARHASLLKGGLTGMGHVRVAPRMVEPEWPEPASEERRRVSAWR